MTERLAVLAMALLALLALGTAPWAAVNREAGARSAVLLLPNRAIDFTGRTDPVRLPAGAAVLVLSAGALLAIGGAAALRPRARQIVWLAAGSLLIVVTAAGQAALGDAVQEARVGAFVEAVERAIERPRGEQDSEALAAVAAEAHERPLPESLAAADRAGLFVRRLPYGNAGPALAAFLALVTGGLAVLFGLRLVPALGREVDRTLRVVAVPATSILLALLAAGVVVLLLQPTPVGRGVELEPGSLPWLAGRLDTVWYAFLTLFADSLGTLNGFAESLNFATPLIFTGLSVAFGFQAGLFNIGAPGQMVLGAIFAMLVGVYLPGPGFVVLPLAVVASAVGGGLWGALPGWLKARFGANEVINTILLNFVAASLLLFLLSSSAVFAAPALRALQFVGGFALIALLASLAKPARRLFARGPRVAFAVAGVLLLGGVVLVARPAIGEPPVTVRLPFKAPGSEPKSHPLQPGARIAQLPHLLGEDPTTAGPDTARLVLAPWFGLAAALAALALLPRVGVRRPGPRLVSALGFGLATYGLSALLGGNAVVFEVPSTNLNLSFLIAIAAAVFMQVFLWRTRWGYELRAVGVAPKAAEYGGASIGGNVILAMAVSGAFAGLTATHYVLGGALEDYSLRQSLPTSDGFDGIAVALLGGNAPLGIVLSAFLFGVLKNGGSVLNITFTDLTRDVVSMILALVVLFIAARGFLPSRLTDPLRAGGRAYAEEDPTVTETIDPPGAPRRSDTARGRQLRDEEEEG